MKALACLALLAGALAAHAGPLAVTVLVPVFREDVDVQVFGTPKLAGVNTKGKPPAECVRNPLRRYAIEDAFVHIPMLLRDQIFPSHFFNMFDGVAHRRFSSPDPVKQFTCQP